VALSKTRPAPFQPGTRLGDHYAIEGLVRLGEGRMFYLANDNRPDMATRKCFECGTTDTPRSETHCVQCGAEHRPRRFMVSARWDAELFEPYERYQRLNLTHPGLVPTIDTLQVDSVICTITEWGQETLMVDEGAPIARTQMIDLALRTVGLLAFLQTNGVEIAPLTQANFIRTDSGDFKLFDLEIRGVQGGPLSTERIQPGLESLARTLRRFSAVHDLSLMTALEGAIRGRYTLPMEFGRALESAIPVIPEEKTAPTAAAMTDVGLLRVLNEDNWGWIQLTPDVQLYVAADGMGGHEAGEVASRMAVDTICREASVRFERANQISPETLENILDESFQAANNGIKDHSEQMGNDMGTTLVAALVYQNSLAFVANVGDSRGYLMRDSVLHQITRDHSLVARMVEQNRLTPEDARHHPHSNILLRTVGTERNVEIDIFSVELEQGDRLMLCSDGLWGEIEDEDIEAILNHYQDPRVVCREMIRAAHHGGGKDNITVVMAEIH
jgi:serine/threonine protein phosphatase PrpC